METAAATQVASTNQLLKQLETLSKTAPIDLLTANLEERKREELDLHDQMRDTDHVQSLNDRERVQLLGNRKFYWFATDFFNYIQRWIESHASGKVVLDYACGDGLYTIMAARSGAALAIGIDISGVSVANAKRDALAAGLQDRTFFLQADCENTKLPDSSIDVIICSGMLHHLDLSYAFPEMRRILKPGGVILGAEALSYNPLIKLYRRLTPQMRSKWEAQHILSYRELRFARHFFQVTNVRHFMLMTLWGFYLPPLLPVFRKIDSLLLSIPLLKLMSWMFTFELRKAEDSH